MLSLFAVGCMAGEGNSVDATDELNDDTAKCAPSESAAEDEAQYEIENKDDAALEGKGFQSDA